MHFRCLSKRVFSYRLKDLNLPPYPCKGYALTDELNRYILTILTKSSNSANTCNQWIVSSGTDGIWTHNLLLAKQILSHWVTAPYFQSRVYVKHKPATDNSSKWRNLTLRVCCHHSCVTLSGQTILVGFEPTSLDCHARECCRPFLRTIIVNNISRQGGNRTHVVSVVTVLQTTVLAARHTYRYRWPWSWTKRDRSQLFYRQHRYLYGITTFNNNLNNNNRFSLYSRPFYYSNDPNEVRTRDLLRDRQAFWPTELYHQNPWPENRTQLIRNDSGFTDHPFSIKV